MMRVNRISQQLTGYSKGFQYRSVALMQASEGGHWKNTGRQDYSGNRQLAWLAAVPLFGFALVEFLKPRRADNCGIVGVVGTDDSSGYLLEGLTILRNRGYDSAGLATVPADGSYLVVTKYASRESTSDSIDLLRNNAGKHVGHPVGIGHTRWATHGGKTDENAHPHTDSKGRVAVIHNGTINNSYDLKKELISQGVVFRSETDTEVIAHLIGFYLDKGFTTKDAVSHSLARCEGSWGLAVLNHARPDEIVVACNGSPM
eukprot:gene3128-6154_t